MRIAQSVFAGSIAVLAILASPALANGTTPNPDANAQKVDQAPTASCYAYQQAPDGSWTQLACHEGGMAAAPPPVHTKSANHHTGEESTTR